MDFVHKLMIGVALTFGLGGCLRAHFEGAYDSERPIDEDPGAATRGDDASRPDAGEPSESPLARNDAGPARPPDVADLCCPECDCGCGGTLISDATQVLNQYCSSCHGPEGTAAGMFHTPLDVAELVASGLVIPDDADNSPLWQRMANGSMPPPGSPQPSAREQSSVASWIVCGAESWDAPEPTPRPKFEYTYDSCQPAQDRVDGVLSTYCASCHGADSAREGGFGVVLDARQMVRQHWVVPDDPESSLVWRSIADGTMPPRGSPPLSKDDAEMVLGWVLCGAADWNPSSELEPSDAGAADSGAELDAGLSAP